MEDRFPVHAAIQNVITLFDYDKKVTVISKVDDLKEPNNKIWCVVSDNNNESSFLEHISSAACEKLSPIIIVSLISEEQSPLRIFRHLSETFPVPIRIRFVTWPFDLTNFLMGVKELTEAACSWENPFRNILKLISPIYNTLTKDSLPQVYREISKSAEERKEGFSKRLEKYHAISSKGKEMEELLSFECCLENIYALMEPDTWIGKKVLWIENNPGDPLLQRPQQIFEYFKYTVDIKSKPDDINKCYEELKSGSDNYHGYELILIDMFLGLDLSGSDFLKILSRKYPHIPAFIVSSSEDFDLISKTIKEGADFYILKKYAISIPHYVRKCYESLGKIILSFKSNRDIQPNLIGNLRYWRFYPDSLWFGDKCYHMINHSYEHTMNDWGLLNELLVPILEKEGRVDITELNLYCLCMAVWLHDMGHSGNERYGTPYEIRDNHGIISGEFILKYPDLCRIYNDDKEIESLYKNIVFPFGTQQKSVIQLIFENAMDRKKLCTLEKIALLCIYHKSNSPVTKEEYINLVNKGAPIPIDFFETCDRKTNVITLDDILLKLDDEEEGRQFKLMVSLFRFIDSLDIKQNRVGSENEKDIKSRIVSQDKKYLFGRLRQELESIIQRYSGKGELNPLTRLSLIKIFYEDVKGSIDKGESVGHLLNLKEAVPGISSTDLDNYFMLANYASFISVQDGHFDFHSAIDAVEIKPINDQEPQKVEIIYTSNKESKKLKDKVVRDPGERDKRSIIERLIGKEERHYKDGYIVNEYESGRPILSKFIELTQITLKCSDEVSIRIKYNTAVKKWEVVKEPEVADVVI